VTMLAVYKPPVRTPIPFSTAMDCLAYALQRVLGKNPTDEVLALALAKCALETGRWSQMWCDNWGNVKAGDSYIGQYTGITLNEVLVRNGVRKLVWFSPEGELSAAPSKGGKLIGKPCEVPPCHPQTRMRAYANPYDGSISYIEFVAGGYYREAFAQLLKGDAKAYVHALKMAKYFTADEAPYARGVESLQREMLNRIRAEEPPPKIDLEWERLIAAVPGMQFDVAELLDGDFVEAA
jgi:hypothetical protein